MNISVYAARFATFKSFGFNYVRLHSHWEAPGYYAAADEAGVFVSSALPGNCAQPACTNLTLRTWKTMIKAHRNHPSIFDNGMGNEHCKSDHVDRHCCNVSEQRLLRGDRCTLDGSEWAQGTLLQCLEVRTFRYANSRLQCRF